MTARLLCSVMVLAGLLLGGPSVQYIAGVPCDADGRRLVDPPTDPPGDTLYSFPVPRTWPGALARQDDWFWSCDIAVDSIYRLDSTGVVDAQWPLPSGSGGAMEWDGANLWLVSEQNAKLYKLDTATCTVLDSFSLPDSAAVDPNSWGLAWDGQYLWHSQYGSRAMLFKLDPATGAVLHSFPPPVLSILGITWDNDYLCGVECRGYMLYRMDPADSSVVDSTPWLLNYALGLDWDGGSFWNVEGDTCRAYRIDGYVGIAGPGTAPCRHDRVLRLVSSNPFTTSATVAYACPGNTRPRLEVVDRAGRLVNTLEPGAGRATWDGTDRAGRPVPNGVYFIQLMMSEGTRGAASVLLVR